MSGTIHPVTHCHTTEDLNPQRNSCENLKSESMFYVSRIISSFKKHTGKVPRHATSVRKWRYNSAHS